MRTGPVSTSPHAAWATVLAQTTVRAATHQSSPTDRPVERPTSITPDTVIRRASQHTFDIRV